MRHMAKEEREMGWRRIGRKRKREGAKGKGKGKSVLVACLAEEETDPRNTETPESEANFARRHINLPNVLGCNDWERKNWEKECSRIIDTGFNGGWLCSFSRLNRYVEYLKSFYSETKLFKKNEHALKFVFWNHQGRRRCPL